MVLLSTICLRLPILCLLSILTNFISSISDISAFSSDVIVNMLIPTCPITASNLSSMIFLSLVKLSLTPL